MRRLHAGNAWVLAAGGLAGALARWGAVETLPQAVLAVNSVGSALLGAVVAEWLVGPAPDCSWVDRRALLIDFLTSFCGSFTTFSAVALVAAEHLDQGSTAGALGSLALSFGISLPASWLGFRLWQQRVLRRRPHNQLPESQTA